MVIRIIVRKFAIVKFKFVNTKNRPKMDIVSRLKVFLKQNGIANSQFADTCEIPRATLSQLLNGRNKKVSDEIITKIHTAYPSLNILWLMFGDGESVSARLVDNSKRRSEVEGARITFWIDSEQVEVVDSKVTIDAKGLKLPKGAKAL